MRGQRILAPVILIILGYFMLNWTSVLPVEAEEIMPEEDVPVQPQRNCECNEQKILVSKDRREFERKVGEVVDLWNMFLDDAGCTPEDSRRGTFREYAEYVVTAVRMYTEMPTTLGGQLPPYEDMHLLVATMITKESSVIADVVGAAPRHEVGLLQVWGVALNGFSRKEVQRNPWLGVVLGVRWLAYHFSTCSGPEDTWADEDLLGPVTAYGSGPRAVRKDGTCHKWGFAKERLMLMAWYRTRIKNSTL